MFMGNTYWWLSINPKMLRFRDLEVGDCFYYTALNEDGTPRTLYKNFTEIKKGDCIGQAIFMPFLVADDDNANGIRTGGFGSTNK